MSKFKNVLDAFCARASKFNGWKMEWSMETDSSGKRMLTFMQPSEGSRSKTVLLLNEFGLHEVYGRMAHLGATVMDKAIFRVVLSEGDANVPPPKPSFEELVGLLG